MNRRKLYDKLHKQCSARSHVPHAYEEFSKLTYGHTTLEIGCGDGWLEVLNPEIVGTDFSILALKKAKRRAHDADFICSDAHYLPFREHFDLIVSIGCFEHFAKPNLSAREMFRVLKNSGRVVMSVDTDQIFNKIYSLINQKILHLIGKLTQPEINLPKNELHAIFVNAGFKVKHGHKIVVRYRGPRQMIPFPFMPSYFFHVIKTENQEKKQTPFGRIFITIF